MARKQLNLEDVMNLPYAQLKGVVEHYSQKQSGDFSNTLNQLVESNFEQHFEKLEINTTCPSCPSEEVSKNGKRYNIQQFKYKDCHMRFTDTILWKTRWHWDIWVKVLEMVINHYPIHHMMNVLVND
ncbi:TPA: hypothetical protein ACGPA6_001129 [Streptococcus suis]